MRNSLRILFVFLVSIVTATMTAADDNPFQPVQDLFAAMSAKDADRMFATGTADFELLEVGEVWDMQMLADAVTGGDTNWTRRNYFAVITSKIDGNKAWVSYWNKAVISVDGREDDIILRWLESAVMIKQGDQWIIEILHSTRLTEDQKIPEGVKLIEYAP